MPKHGMVKGFQPETHSPVQISYGKECVLCEASWSFIQAHNGHFWKGVVTVPDLELNDKAGHCSMRPYLEYIFGFVLLQVLFGVLSTTPNARFSEKVVSDAVLRWAQLVKLVPAVGISMDVVEDWCNKMAFGVKILVGRFRKMWKESPLTSRSPKLSVLKTRLNEVVSSISPIEPPTPSSSLSSPVRNVETPVDFVGKHCFRGLPSLEDALEEACQEAPSGTSTATPSTSPALSSSSSKTTSSAMELPDWVLNLAPVFLPKICVILLLVEALKALKAAPCVKPFAIHVDVQVEDDCPGTKETKPKKSKKEKRPVKPKQAKQKAGQKKVADISMDDLAQYEVEVDALVRQEVGDVKYTPQDFSKAKNKFIKGLRSRSDLCGKDAWDRWMISSLRSDFLSTLDERELKKRRFC